MARRVFFSFHFDKDYWRTQQVRNMNALEGNPLATPNAWEQVKRQGDTSIKRWIDAEMQGRSCAIVLVGEQTALRPWVQYEIEKAWNDNRGVLGIRIHGLLDNKSLTSPAGPNPFDRFTIKGKSMSTLAPLMNPAGADSKAVYATISNNIESWIEAAITARKNS